MVTILPIAYGNDNYCYLLRKAETIVLIDPGDASKVDEVLQLSQIKPSRILLTHYHQDHCGGARFLADKYGALLAGPAGVGQENVDNVLEEEGSLETMLSGIALHVLQTPGHTAVHCCYHLVKQGELFTGDTMFSAGCGRIMGGSAEQLFCSLQRLASLDKGTRVWFGHEYTCNNLRFALCYESTRVAAQSYLERIEGSDSGVTTPSTIELELRINPFLN